MSYDPRSADPRFRPLRPVVVAVPILGLLHALKRQGGLAGAAAVRDARTQRATMTSQVIAAPTGRR